MTTTLFSATTLLFAHAKTEASDTSQAGQLVFSPSYGWIIAIIAILVLLAAMFFEIVPIRRKPESSDETFCMRLRRIGICIMLIICVLSPSIMRSTLQRAVNATNVIIALDITGSMRAKDADYAKNSKIERIDAARNIIRQITKSYANSSFAAISFGASTSVDVPLTPDARAVDNWINTLRTEPTSVATGTSLDAPIDQTLLTAKAIHDAHPDDTTVLYVLSDGEETTQRKRRTFSSLRAYITNAFVIGIGSSKGAKIPLEKTQLQLDDYSEDNTSNQWVIDPATGNPGISKLDEKNLRNIADELSGKYMHSSLNVTFGDEAKPILSHQWRMNETAKPRLRPEPIIWPFAIFASILLIWELMSWFITSRKLV
ncbi:vWA domain-containing protein [Gardnerella sp. Marseille-Q9179]|uniref:vWA domain-containing protein n=1 Tax=Gardnerella TaxID=2701 RepID=UPI0039F0E89D